MKRITVFALLAAALVVSCGPKAPTPVKNHDVTGQISGDWGKDAKVRLAVVGGGLPNLFVNEGALDQKLEFDSATKIYKFGVNLDNVKNDIGAYQIVAYNDISGNGKLDLKEPFARNDKFMIYSPKDQTYGGVKIKFPKEVPIKVDINFPKMTLKEGWNMFDTKKAVGADNPVSVSKFTEYNIAKTK